MNMKTNSLDIHARVGETFEHLFGQQLLAVYDRDIRKVTDDYASFGDFRTPCRVLIELKSRKFLPRADFMAPSFARDTWAYQLKAGLEQAVKNNFMYAFIVGVHKLQLISELDSLKNDRAAFLGSYDEFHVVLGDALNVSYMVLSLEQLRSNPRGFSFREMLINLNNDGRYNRPFNVGQFLSAQQLQLTSTLDRAADKLAALHAVIEPVEPAEPVQELMMYPTQRVYNFDELDYASIMLEDRHDKRSINATSLVYIKDLNIDQHTKKRLKDKLARSGHVSTRIHILNSKDLFANLTFLHFGLKVPKAKDKTGRTRLTNTFKIHLKNHGSDKWKVCDPSIKYLDCIRRFHEVLESKGLIHNYLLFDPTTESFKGFPVVNWTHQDHVDALLRHLDNDQAPPIMINDQRIFDLENQVSDLKNQVSERDAVIDSLLKRFNQR